MRWFVAEGELRDDIDELVDKGINWTEYRIWRKLYDALKESGECCWKTDAEGAEVCKMHRPQYIKGIEGLLKKGMLHSLGEGRYEVTCDCSADYICNDTSYTYDNYNYDYDFAEEDIEAIRDSDSWEKAYFFCGKGLENWVKEIPKEEREQRYMELRARVINEIKK